MSDTLLQTVRTSAFAFLILIGAHVFNPFLALTRIPTTLSEALIGTEFAPLGILLILLAAFIVLGIIGLFLPILQGILFLLIGFILLSRESEWAQRRLEMLKTRYPRFAEKYDAAEAAADRLWNRITRNGSGA